MRKKEKHNCRTLIPYVLLFLFLLLRPVYSEGQTDKLGAKTAEQAYTYLGVPYVFAGTSSHGMDCSGLVYRVYLDKGVDVPRTVRALINTGRRVPGGLQQGDLLFFDTLGRGPSHVGLYLGNNQFIHAASEGLETGVIISSLNETYYAQRYLYARRIADTLPAGTPASPGLAAQITGREPQDIVSMRLNSFLGWSPEGLITDHFEASLTSNLNLGSFRFTSTLGLESHLLTDKSVQLAMYQEAALLYKGTHLIGSGLQWDWARWNANMNNIPDNNTLKPDKRISVLGYFGGHDEQWQLKARYALPIPWVSSLQYAANIRLDGFYRPFHWLQLEAGIFKHTLSRSALSSSDSSASGETDESGDANQLDLLDHTYGFSTALGVRFPAAFLWGLQYRYRTVTPLPESDHLNPDSRGLWTLFLEYSF